MSYLFNLSKLLSCEVDPTWTCFLPRAKPKKVRMTVPGFQQFFLHMLKFAADGQEHSMAEARSALASGMGFICKLTQSLFDYLVDGC